MFSTTIFLFSTMVAGVFSTPISDISLYDKSNPFSTQLLPRMNDNTPFVYVTPQPMMQPFQLPIVNNQWNPQMFSSIISPYNTLMEYAKMNAYNQLMIPQNAYPLYINYQNPNSPYENKLNFNPVIQYEKLEPKQNILLDDQKATKIQDHNPIMYKEEELNQKVEENLNQKEEDGLSQNGEQLRLKEEESRLKTEAELRLKEEEELRLRKEEEELRLRKEEEELKLRKEEEEIRLRREEEELRLRKEEEEKELLRQKEELKKEPLVTNTPIKNSITRSPKGPQTKVVVRTYTIRNGERILKNEVKN